MKEELMTLDGIGDLVKVEMSAYDMSKGRIVFREKLGGQHSGHRRRPSGRR